MTVTDTLYTPTHQPVTGSITITANQTFTAADGSVVAIGQRQAVDIVAGFFTINLVPNVNSTPTGTSYTAAYKTSVQNFTETWVVPQSATPVNLLQVRALPAPVPAIVIPASQLLPPPNCTGTLNILWWTGTGWQCKAANTGVINLDLEFPIPPDTGKFQFKVKNGITLTRISCSVDQDSVSINLDLRTESTPNNQGSSILVAPLACAPVTSVSTNFSTAAIPGGSPVALDVVSASGAPGVVRVHAEYILN